MVAYRSPGTPGTIVLLNGASCSGKTSIARAIQELMEDPWLHVGLDHFERETALVDGAWYGDVIMGILEHEYRATRVTSHPRHLLTRHLGADYAHSMGFPTAPSSAVALDRRGRCPRFERERSRLGASTIE